MKLNPNIIPRYINQNPELFKPNTTETEIEKLALWVIKMGKKTSKPHLRVQFYELNTRFQEKTRRYRAVVDTVTDELITIHPMSI